MNKLLNKRVSTNTGCCLSWRGAKFEDAYYNKHRDSVIFPRMLLELYVILDFWLTFMKICSNRVIYFGTLHQLDSYHIAHCSPA